MATQNQIFDRDEKQSISNCFSLEENTQNSFQKRVKCFQERKNSFLKTISRIGFLIIMCLIPLLATSQEIKWAKSSNIETVYQSCFDSQGNLYLIGAASKLAEIDTTKIFPDNITQKKGMFIGKFDTIGKLQWLKSIQTQNYNIEYSSMVLIGDTSLLFTAPIYMPNFFEYTFFLDTIIQGKMTEIPYNLGSITAFVKLNTINGELEDFHALQGYESRTDGTSDFKTAISFYESPISVDNEGNIYFFFYRFLDTTYCSGFNLVIDGTDSIYAGDAHTGYSKIIKVSKDFEFIWVKDIIFDTPGLSETITPKFLHAVNEENNIYLTGYIQRSIIPKENNYIKYIDIGNDNKITISNPIAGYGLSYIGFVIKYDTSGTSLWSNQIYGGADTNNKSSIASFYYYSIPNEKYLYVLGGLSGFSNNGLYFDSSHYHKYNASVAGTLVIKYNKENGKYLTHGSSCNSAENVNMNKTLSIINGNMLAQVYNFSNAYIPDLDSTISEKQGNWFLWNEEGDIVCIKNKKSDYAGNTTYNELTGEVFLSGTYSNISMNLDLGDTVLPPNKTYMLMLKDSSFLNHYTVIRDTICDSADWKGNHITWKGDYYDTLQAADGYDSIIIYRVQVRHSFKEEISVEINEGETYDFHGQILSSAGTYYDSLQTINGCDSVYILNLSVKSGLEDITDYSNNKNRIKIIPNPAKDIVTIEAYGDVSIINGKGQVVRIIKDVNGKKVLNIADLEEGVYYLQIGNSSEKFIKQ